VYIKDPNFCDSGVRRRVRYRDRDVAACPCTNTPASKCVTEPNLVALHQTIWVYVGYCRVPKISGILGPRSVAVVVWVTPWKYAPPHVLLDRILSFQLKRYKRNYGSREKFNGQNVFRHFSRTFVNLFLKLGKLC